METDPKEAAEFRMMVELEDRGLLQAAFNNPMLEMFAWDAKNGAYRRRE